MGVGGTNFQLLMLSPNFLQSKISMSGGEGGDQFPTFDAESKFATQKKFFAKNFLSFRAKKCLGMVLDFEYQVVRVYEVYANHKYKLETFRKSDSTFFSCNFD